MAALNRKRFEGVLNILKFNWHFFALAGGIGLVLFASLWFLPQPAAIFAKILLAAMLFSTFLSLAASFYIYDRSNLYTFNWLAPALPGLTVLNLHAGFDESSFLLARKYPEARLQVFDFYDPERHTEVSIKRARKEAPVFPGTIAIATSSVPTQPGSADLILTMLAAHEIRDARERINFFQQLRKSLKPTGKLIVVEHLRDLPNFLVYNFGAFHFLPKREWEQTFHSAGLRIESELKITVFVTVFFLKPNGSAS